MPEPTAADRPETPADPNERRALVLQELSVGLRDPFRRELARLLAIPVTDDDLRAFAAKAPDRHFQSIAILGRLAGYSDHLEVTATRRDVSSMSDSELLAELSQSLGLSPDDIRKRLSPRALPPARSPEP
jgi:hypothetical protein